MRRREKLGEDEEKRGLLEKLRQQARAAAKAASRAAQCRAGQAREDEHEHELKSRSVRGQPLGTLVASK